MNPREAVDLARYLRAHFPQQPIDEFTADALAETCGEYPAADCRAAVLNLAERGEQWCSPTAVKAEVKRIRAKRIADYGPIQPPAGLDPDDVRGYQRWLGNITKAIADGEVTAPPVIETTAGRDVIAELGRRLGRRDRGGGGGGDVSGLVPIPLLSGLLGDPEFPADLRPGRPGAPGGVHRVGDRDVDPGGLVSEVREAVDGSEGGGVDLPLAAQFVIPALVRLHPPVGLLAVERVRLAAPAALAADLPRHDVGVRPSLLTASEAAGWPDADPDAAGPGASKSVREQFRYVALVLAALVAPAHDGPPFGSRYASSLLDGGTPRQETLTTAPTDPAPTAAGAAESEA